MPNPEGPPGMRSQDKGPQAPYMTVELQGWRHPKSVQLEAVIRPMPGHIPAQSPTFLEEACLPTLFQLALLPFKRKGLHQRMPTLGIRHKPRPNPTTPRGPVFQAKPPHLVARGPSNRGSRDFTARWMLPRLHKRRQPHSLIEEEIGRLEVKIT